MIKSISLVKINTCVQGRPFWILRQTRRPIVLVVSGSEASGTTAAGTASAGLGGCPLLGRCGVVNDGLGVSSSSSVTRFAIATKRYPRLGRRSINFGFSGSSWKASRKRLIQLLIAFSCSTTGPFGHNNSLIFSLATSLPWFARSKVST